MSAERELQPETGRRSGSLKPNAEGPKMTSNRVRRLRRMLAGMAAFLAIAVEPPPSAQGALCHAAFDFQHLGFCSATTRQSCLVDGDCPSGELCIAPNFLVPGDPILGRTRLRVDLGAGPIFVLPFPPQVTISRFRFDLDCVENSGGPPCTDQGDVVEYLGDATITSNCQAAGGAVTWTTTTEQGGNEIVFTPSTPLVIDQNVAPGDTTRGGCSVAFDLQVVNPEPAPGQPNSDGSPQVVEQAFGCINGAGDCTCSPTLQAGSSQTDGLVLCPTCTGEACECDVSTGVCVPPEPGASCPSTTTTTTTTTTIPNRPPDCSGAVASPNELSPPNHQFVNVSVGGLTDPDGDPVTLTITGITQDEPVKGAGTGNTCPDAAGVGTAMASLRAERSGSGDGRVYHVAFRADDGKGGACSGSVAVCVPVARACVDQGALVDSTSCP